MIYEGKSCITYYDLDMAERLKFSALLRMVHIAADVNAADLGIGFTELSARNMSFILNRFSLKILEMPKYNDIVTIRTWAHGILNGTFIRKGDMYAESGGKIMEWASQWILLDLEARKILRPAAIGMELPTHENEGVEVMPQKIFLPKGEDLQAWRHFAEYTHTVRYCEVDTNLHMNNSMYGDLINNVLRDTELSPSMLQINYLVETKLDENIVVKALQKGNEFLITGVKEDGRNAFTALIS